MCMHRIFNVYSVDFISKIQRKLFTHSLSLVGHRNVPMSLALLFFIVIAIVVVFPYLFLKRNSNCIIQLKVFAQQKWVLFSYSSFSSSFSFFLLLIVSFFYYDSNCNVFIRIIFKFEIVLHLITLFHCWCNLLCATGRHFRYAHT